MNGKSERRVLVSGANGFVGKNLQDMAGSYGWQLIAPSRAEWNLLDRDSSVKFVKSVAPDAIVHAAGVVGGIQANIAAPYKFLAQNLVIGESLVSAARAAQVPVLLNLGSSCMFPRTAPNPLSEEMILKGELEPTNEGYAIAKIATQRLCEYARREDPNLLYKTLVPCNLYGPHDSFALDKSHLIAAVIAKIHSAKEEGAASVEVWGDGLARREFMYVGDLVDAIFRALSDPESIPDVINIGVGVDHCIDEYYRVVAEIVGWSGELVHDVSKPVGMNTKLVDTQRQTAWGWSPQVSLEQGIEMTYRFFLREAKP